VAVAPLSFYVGAFSVPQHLLRAPIDLPERDLPEHIRSLSAKLAAKPNAPSEELAQEGFTLTVARLVNTFRELGWEDPSLLDMSFMRTTFRQQVNNRGHEWLVPRYAMVDFDNSGPSFCSLTYDGKNSASWPPSFHELLDMRALNADTPILSRLLQDYARNLRFTFYGAVPEDICLKAKVAQGLGFSVRVVCDARGQWNKEHMNLGSEVMLVAKLNNGWLYLDSFDPTGI
jgi:hypothetical protein